MFSGFNILHTFAKAYSVLFKVDCSWWIYFVKTQMIMLHLCGQSTITMR